MGMDDIYQGFNVFKQNMQELGMQRTLRGANEAVQQIRSSELDEDKKVNQLRGVAENLTFNLAAQGVPATSIKALTQFSPKDPTTIDAALLSPSESIRQRGLEASEAKNKSDLFKTAYIQDRTDQRHSNSLKQSFQLAEEREKLKMDQEGRKALTHFQDSYNKNVKELRDATRYAEQAIKILDSDGGAEKMMGAVQFLAARASGSNSQLSDGERMALSGRQDLLEKAKQAIASGTFSEFTNNNKAALKDMLNVYTTSSKAFEGELANSYTGQLKANPLFADKPYDELATKITGGRIKKYTGKGIELSNDLPSPAQVVQPAGAGPAPVTPAWAKPRK